MANSLERDTYIPLFFQRGSKYPLFSLALVVDATSALFFTFDLVV